MGEQPSAFSAYTTQVCSEWLDYNGHMHDASYAIAFSDAHEELFQTLGLSTAYRAAGGASMYTVECHIRYLAECSLGQRLSASTVLVDAGTKMLRLYTELRHSDGSAVATADALYLHVDTDRGVTTALPIDRQEVVQEMLAAHRGIQRPPHLGLGVGAARIGSAVT